MTGPIVLAALPALAAAQDPSPQPIQLQRDVEYDIGALLRTLSDPSPWVRRWAITGILRIGGLQYICAVTPLLDDPNPIVRDVARTAVATLGISRE